MPEQQPIKLFYSYSHKDETLRDQLETHLKILQRQKVIDTWHDRKIGAGADWQKDIDDNLATADIILLLISADFLASAYCFDVEIQRAMQKHNEKSAVVIPISLRPCVTKNTEFMKCQGLPKNFKPVTTWSNQDEAFTDIVEGISMVAERIRLKKASEVVTVDKRAAAEVINSAAIADQADTQTITNLLPEVTLGADFKKFLHKQISAELLKPEARWLKEQLADLFHHDKTAKDLVALLTDSLLEPPVDEAIRDYLTLAASDCICPTGCRYPEVSDKVALVRQAAEQILGWLVLSSINENEIRQILPCCTQHEALFFKLGVDSFAGVEIVLSRRFGRNTAWPNKDSANPHSRYLIPPQESWFKWDGQETVRKILIEIWNTVFPALEAQKGPDDKLDETEIEKLDATLRSRRIKPRNTEHYYIAFKLPEGSSAFAENMYQQLLCSLKQMTVVQFGVECLDKLFLLPEARITTEINEFYREINGLAGQ